MNKGINNPGFRALPQSVQSKIISRMKYGGNMYAAGGPMNQLTEFTEGGTHEENPIGGIPQGTSPNGQMNLVEQGETKLNNQNYIFSDQLKLDAVTAAEFNLPKSFVGKTFAEASKKMDKPNSRRENDTIEMADTERNLAKLKEAQEFHKQQEVQKKIDEIMALDPNALASMMGQGQQGQPPMDPNMMGQGAPEQMGPEEMAMMEQEAMMQQGAAGGDAAMMQQMGMMRNGGMMYANGGDMDNFGGPGDPPKFSFDVSNPYNVQDTTDERYQYPASAIDAIMYKTPEEAKAGLFKRENDASRTYFNNPDTREMGEFVGDQDAYNNRFQDWNPEKSRAIIQETRFPAEGDFTRSNNFETAPYLNKKEARQYKTEYEEDLQNMQTKRQNNPSSLSRATASYNPYNLGGFIKDNKQGILGGLQTAAGIGAMFIPGMQGLGSNLIGGGIGNITGEIQGDKQAEMQKKALEQQKLLAKQQANLQPQQGLDPYGNPIAPQGMGMMRNGGRMYNVGGYMNANSFDLPDSENMLDPNDIDFEENQEEEILSLEDKNLSTNEKKKEHYAKVGDLTDTTMDLSIDQSPLDFGLQVAPIAWNLAKGLQKPMEFKGSQFYTKIDPSLVDYTNAENTAKETGAGAMKSIKNTVPGGGSYAANVLATQQNINKALAEIDTLEANTNSKLKGDADKLNITRKDAANMQALQMNLAAQQAKELLLQEALTQGKGMSEQATANDLAQKYAVMSAPDISRFKKVGYNPYYQQVLESIKNRKTTSKK